MRRNRGFTLLETLVTLSLLAVLGLLISRLTQSTLKTMEETRTDDRSNAALDRALMLLRKDAWSARAMRANVDGSISVGDVTWRAKQSTLTRSQAGDETLNVGTPIGLRIDGAEVVVEAAGRVVRMTGPARMGGAS